MPNQAVFGRLCWEVQDQAESGGERDQKTADTGTLALKERLADKGQANTEGEPEEALHNTVKRWMGGPRRG